MSSCPYSATAEAVVFSELCGSHSLPGLSKRSSGLISDATSSLKTDRSSKIRERNKNRVMLEFNYRKVAVVLKTTHMIWVL